MSKHTPGPWEWDSTPWQYDKENEAPWLMQKPWQGINSKRILGGSIHCESEADARLIAAAPDMYEFAQWILTLKTGGMIEGRARALVQKVEDSDDTTE